MPLANGWCIGLPAAMRGMQWWCKALGRAAMLPSPSPSPAARTVEAEAEEEAAVEPEEHVAGSPSQEPAGSEVAAQPAAGEEVARAVLMVSSLAGPHRCHGILICRAASIAAHLFFF